MFIYKLPLPHCPVGREMDFGVMGQLSHARGEFYLGGTPSISVIRKLVASYFRERVGNGYDTRNTVRITEGS